jgi:hypothetical protein
MLTRFGEILTPFGEFPTPGGLMLEAVDKVSAREILPGVLELLPRVCEVLPRLLGVLPRLAEVLPRLAEVLGGAVVVVNAHCRFSSLWVPRACFMPALKVLPSPASF